MCLALALWCPTGHAEEALSLELLEFLVEWQDESGGLVDPFDLPEPNGSEEIPEESDDGER